MYRKIWSIKEEVNWAKTIIMMVSSKTTKLTWERKKRRQRRLNSRNRSKRKIRMLSTTLTISQLALITALTSMKVICLLVTNSQLRLMIRNPRFKVPIFILRSHTTKIIKVMNLIFQTLEQVASRRSLSQSQFKML